MSDDRARLRRETEHALNKHKDATAEYNAIRSKLEDTGEALKIALYRENTFLATGTILSDEQITKMRYGL
jgi:hypothetical protein